MLASFDTEYGFKRVVSLNGDTTHADITTFVPVCACVKFEDGHELRLTHDWQRLQALFNDPQYTFVVHGMHAEFQFCERVGLRFPAKYIDTLLMALVVNHATTFQPQGGSYKQSGLAALAVRYNLPFIEGDEKNRIRDSIMRLTHVEEFGMPHVLDYCMADCDATLKVLPLLVDELNQRCGPHARKNIEQLYQPYALAMAKAAQKGIRFDKAGWDRLLNVAPIYRGQLLSIMRDAGYDHDGDGDGIGQRAFAKMLRTLGLDKDWRRTKSDQFSTQEDDLKARRHLHPAIDAICRLKGFNSFLTQDMGSRVDRDGYLRCGILTLAQRTGRNSTTKPNLMGIPCELRPLLLPDEGCVFVHFDFSQQEPGIAGYLSGCQALQDDFSNGDVYLNLGLRLGLITPSTPKDEAKKIRSSILKSLMLAILYGKSARTIAADLGISLGEAQAHMTLFQKYYGQLFSWLRGYVSAGLQRGWAANVIGFRAAFNVLKGDSRGHIARSCQNFPIQSSAASCFQLTGTYLADMGCDIRLPIHDAYLLNCPNDSRSIGETRKKIISATTNAVHQLFPGLRPRREIEVLSRFAKDGNENAFVEWVSALEEPQCALS